MTRKLMLLVLCLAGCDDDTVAMDLAPLPDLAMQTDDLAQASDMAVVPPPPAGIKFIDIGNAADLTPDGRYALLQDFTQPGGDVIVYDFYLDQMPFKHSAANPDPAMGNGDAGTPVVPQGAFGLSADASRIVGTHGAPLQAAFLASDGWHDLGSLAATTVCAGDPSNLDDQGSVSSGWGISSDGKTIVGMAWNDCSGSKAIRWTEQGGITALGFAGKSYNRATKVSADGKVVGGWVDSVNVDRSPALWDENGAVTVLDPTGMVIGEVLALSPDGKMAAGPWNDASGNNGFYWTQSDGVKMLPPLATYQPSDQVFPNAITADHSMIFGASGDQNGLGSPLQAFVYTAKDNKIRLLQDLVTAQGYSLPANYSLANVVAVSADGTFVLGLTLDNDPMLPFPKQGVFVLHMPLTAYN